MSNMHWFIKEEAISDHEQDAFAHRDIADQLKFKIEELGAPLTVALSGRHGIGKSSVGSLLSEKFASDDRFVFVRIEAWRHAGEQRRKAFLLDVVEELGRKPIGNEACKTLKAIEKRLSTTQAMQTAVFDIPGSLDAIKSLVSQAKHPVLQSALVAFVLTLFFTFIYYLLSSGVSISIAWNTLWHTLPSVLPLPIVVAFIAAFYKICSSVATNVLEPPKVTITTSPPSSGEQFERIFREILDTVLNTSKGMPGNSKALVIFVDELDRLPPEEIIEALNAIRTFRDVGSCVFVVALDEEVVRLALEKASSSGALISDAEKAQEFLNKFFKIRQQIPPLVLGDMRDFAIWLIKDKQHQRVTEGIAKLPEDQVEAILDALIHRRVKTPRHAIRLINAFNSDYRLGQARESGQKHILSSGAVTQHLPFLGVMTALREDFPDFYDAAIKNPDLINAMDNILSGKTAQDVEDRFPGYVELCVPYFAKIEPEKNEEAAKAGLDEAEREQSQDAPLTGQKWNVDFGVPLDEISRALILLLSETAPFRAPNIRPFVYFREDVAEREVGGELTEQMRQEFETNASYLLRRSILDGTSSHAKAAAQVALSCLEGAKGLRKQNAIRATCEVFDLFTETDKEKIANRVIGYLAKNGEINLPAAMLFDVISHSVVHTDKQQVISKIIERLSKQDQEANNQDLQAIIEHDELVTTPEQKALVSAIIAMLPSTSSAEELQVWFGAIVEHSKSTTVVFDFFGLTFLQNVVTDTIRIEGKDFLQGYLDDLKAVFNVMDEKLEAEEPENYYRLLIKLFGAKVWSFVDLSFTLLQQHTEDLSASFAESALSKIFTSFSSKWPEDNDAAIQRQLRLHTFTKKLFLRHGKQVFTSDAAMKGLNVYFGYALVSEQEQLRSSAAMLLRDLISKFDSGTFELALDALMVFIQAQMPSQQAEAAQALLVSIADHIEKTKLKAHFDAITLSLRQAAIDEKAAFGAEAISMALTSPESSSLRTIALAEATLLVTLIQVNSYPPPVLANAGRILDEAFPILGLGLDSYLNALYSYFNSTTTEANMYFALDHFQPIAQRELVSDNIKNLFVAAILPRWQYMLDVPHRSMAARLLIDWRAYLPESQRPAYVLQQLGFLNEEPAIAWEGLKYSWKTLSLDQRLQIFEAGARNDPMWRQMLHDISLPDAMLTPPDIAALLVSLSLKVEEQRLVQVEGALVEAVSVDDKDTASDLVFLALASSPDHLDRQSLVRVANGLAHKAVPNGLAYYIKLLQDDAPHRLVALTLLPTFLGGKPLSEEQKANLAGALGAALMVDRGEKFRANLSLSKEIDTIQHPAYKAKLIELDQSLRANPSPDNKAALKLLKSHLPKKPKLNATTR